MDPQIDNSQDSQTLTPMRRPWNNKRRLMNGVDVRLGGAFTIARFDAGDLLIRPGDKLVVDSRRGTLIGVAVGLVERRVEVIADIQRVIRRATEEDLQAWEECRRMNEEAMRICVRHIRSQRLPMKLVQAEYGLDRSRVVFYFTSEDRVDFRRLVKSLSTDLHARIDMRQIGVRDGAGVIGGIGPCGGELCCSTFLNSFSSISIRFAKDQGLSLNPQKITGMCGRLKCCLVYEENTYKELKKYAPKPRMGCITPLGTGNILEVDTLNRKVTVELQGGSWESFHLRDVVVLERRLAPEELASARSKEEDVLNQRRQRRGGTQEQRQTMNREAASVLQEDYLWARDEKPTVPTSTELPPREGDDEEDGESSDSPGEDAQHKKRRRRNRNRRREGESSDSNARSGGAGVGAGLPAEGNQAGPPRRHESRGPQGRVEGRDGAGQRRDGRVRGGPAPGSAGGAVSGPGPSSGARNAGGDAQRSPNMGPRPPRPPRDRQERHGAPDGESTRTSGVVAESGSAENRATESGSADSAKRRRRRRRGAEGAAQTPGVPVAGPVGRTEHGTAGAFGSGSTGAQSHHGGLGSDVGLTLVPFERRARSGQSSCREHRLYG